uniref:NADH-ubiquinone oxidoreductase chain 6 n=1 Tax=Lymexylon navale TaxID=295949 RepID=A0A343C1N9_9CUCU|nr:NADH dehydrogenase subunit 6 [Lymexylon navale]
MLLIFMMFSFLLMFIFLNHPLSMGMTILIQTLLMSIMTGNWHFNFWYSYILFLIMIGGLLILFTYMTSVASNEKFKFNIFFLTPFFSLILSPFFEFLFKNYDSLNFNSTNNFNLNLSKFLNIPMNMIIMFLIIYLLITLIAVVKITDFNQGPMRQKN